MKERYRRIPIELIISPAFEDRTADARLVLFSLFFSPRQTPPGVYDGGLKALEYETALPAKRLNIALRELEQAGMIEQVATGGWWVRDTFRYQCMNRDYSNAAIRHLTEKWPDLLPKFTEANQHILGKYTPQTGNTPPTHPPPSPTGSGSEAVTGTETGSGTGAGAAPKPSPATGSGTDTGGRGYQGERVRAGLRTAPLGGASALAHAEKENGKATPLGKGGNLDIRAVAVSYAKARLDCGVWTREKAVNHLVSIYRLTPQEANAELDVPEWET